ncbi:MAG: amidase [Phycisphaerae bacterium]|nr:MAG: amidase [Phycisphaerae bacterium]
MTQIEQPWQLAELNYAFVKEQRFEVAVLPLGCTEPHNLHLPYATDTLEGDAIGDAICRVAHGKGAGVVLLPTIPYGTTSNQRGLPLSMNLNPSTLHAVITDLVRSLEACGIHKLLLLNSHGGNELKPLMRELYGQTGVRIFLCDWFRALGDVYSDIFDAKDDHAGEMETSIMLAEYPDLVARKPDGTLTADEGATRPTRFEAVNQGWVSITRPWKGLTTNTGAGNPHAASADKGRKAIDLLANRIGEFVAELAGSEIDDSFPF